MRQRGALDAATSRDMVQQKTFCRVIEGAPHPKFAQAKVLDPLCNDLKLCLGSLNFTQTRLKMKIHMHPCLRVISVEGQ
jgi:hypothetical protein